MKNSKLKQIYEETLYQIPSLSLTIIVGEKFPALDKIMNIYDKQSWLFITAWNPMGEPASPEKNTKKDRALFKKISGLGLPFWKGRGVHPETDWKPEDSYLVLGIDRSSALQWMNDFDQKAVVFGEIGGLAMLLWWHEEA